MYLLHEAGVKFFALYFAGYACKRELLAEQIGNKEAHAREHAAFKAVDDWGEGGRERFNAEWYAPVIAGLGDFLKIGYTQIDIPEGALYRGQPSGDINLVEHKLVARRMVELSTSSPWPIRAWTIRLIPGTYRAKQAREVEDWFHSYFSQYKMRGEWFRISHAPVAAHPALKAYTIATQRYLPTPWELITADEEFRQVCRDAVWKYGSDGQLSGSIDLRTTSAYLWPDGTIHGSRYQD